MDALTSILADARQRLRAEVPELQYVEKDWGQLAPAQPPVARPCALLDIQAVDYTQQTRGAQRADAQLIVTVADLPPAAETAVNPEAAPDPDPAVPVPDPAPAAADPDAPAASEAPAAGTGEAADPAPAAPAADPAVTPDPFRILHLLERIHAALHGSSSGAYTPLRRTTLRKAASEAVPVCYVLTFETAFENPSASTYRRVPAPEVALTLE